MKIKFCLGIALATLSQAYGFSQESSLSTNHLATAAVAANYGKLPLSFEANQGQTDAQVRFLSRGQGYSLFLTDKAAVLSLAKPSGKSPETRSAESAVVRMELAGAANGLRVDGAVPLPGKKNYFIGSDPAKWHTNVPTFSKVRYTGVYPGVDLLYYGNQQQLEFDFVVAPNASAKPVKLHFDGAESLKLASNGDLKVSAGDGEIAFHQPVVYQKKDGQRQPVEGKFALLAGNTVGFELGSYDHSRELVIDPVLAYSTYIGGSEAYGTDGYAISKVAVDAAGNAYFSGETDTADFPVTSRALKANNLHYSAFVSKLNASGSALMYSTYVSGNAPNLFAVDNAGNVYLAGANIPVTPGAFQTTNSNYGKTSVAKLDSTGSTLVYSTYLGGSIAEQAYGIAADSSGNAYIVGATQSNDFPVTPGAFQTTKTNPSGASTVFVTKLNANGSGLLYSTFLGGKYQSYGMSVFVDSSNHAYVGGLTYSPDFPITPNAYDPTYAPRVDEMAFAAKLNPSGSGLIYSTFFPYVASALDQEGNIYALDLYSYGKDQVTKGAYLKSGSEWLGKLNASGTALVFGTFLVPENATYAFNGLAAGPQGDVFLAGSGGPGFPITSDAYPFKSNPDGQTINAVLAKLNPTGSALTYATYLGGSGSVGSFQNDGTTHPTGDAASAVACDPLGNVYLAGVTSSVDFPVTDGAFQTVNKEGIYYPASEGKSSYGTNKGYANSFVTKFVFNGATTTTVSSSDSSVKLGSSVTFSASVRSQSGGTIPQGHLEFLVDGIPAANVVLDGAGNADYTTSALSAGAHVVNASYFGSKASSSGSAVVTQEVTGGAVAAPIFYPVPGTYAPKYFAGDLAIHNGVLIKSPTPGATIYYTTDGTTPTTSSAVYPVGGAQLINPNPQSSLIVRAIAVQSGNTPSSVTTGIYTINPHAIQTATTLTSSANPSTLGEAVTFTATVKADSGPVPTGTVLFRSGDEVFGTAPLKNGVATFTYSGLSPLGHDITAVYTGNDIDSEKGSPVLFQIVNAQ
ncbi:Cell surface protein [Acidisarcina polymorpha]|uniref:Cell surface protein n=1 Tax=Acidisarcina polymorpha TaxID=2211140 RepID=A0A2Z5G4P9_9BACT|nr:Ig-like domain repeat protein [Acidisarcina polymorpha]AXC13645.1 Cell surface protein [Acidisarcina polymorpha]